MSETWGAPSKHEVWQVESIKPCLKISKWNGHQGGQEWHYPRASTENPIFFSSPINRVGLRPPAPLRWSPKSHISLANSQPSFYNQNYFFVQKLVFISKRLSSTYIQKRTSAPKGGWLDFLIRRLRSSTRWIGFSTCALKERLVTQPGPPLGWVGMARRGKGGERDGVSRSCRNLLGRTWLVIPGWNWDLGVVPQGDLHLSWTA